MAESIFQTLHDLATKEGRLVMASAHCPSSTTFNLFTHLLLLTAVRAPDCTAAVHCVLGFKFTPPPNKY